MKREIPKLGTTKKSEADYSKFAKMSEPSEEMKAKTKLITDSMFEGITSNFNAFNEELDSEFFRVVRELDLPLDRDAIKAAGVVIERGETQIFMEDRPTPYSSMDQTAVITRYGKPISRVIKMTDSRIDSNCLSPTLKDSLIKGGALCEVLDDLKRMTSDATKTLQQLLDEPKQPDHNCTEIEVDPKNHKINRVVCLGIEYK